MVVSLQVVTKQRHTHGSRTDAEKYDKQKRMDDILPSHNPKVNAAQQVQVSYPVESSAPADSNQFRFSAGCL